jgi:hypothetical protein
MQNILSLFGGHFEEVAVKDGLNGLTFCGGPLSLVILPSGAAILHCNVFVYTSLARTRELRRLIFEDQNVKRNVQNCGNSNYFGL